MRRTSRLAEVAAAAGVSTATISRALKRPELVRKETRVVVILAAEKVGYERLGPCFRAIGTRDRRSGGTRYRKSFFSVLTKSVLQELRRSGTSLIVADTNEEPLGEGEILGTMLPRVDGLIVASSRLAEGEMSGLITSKPVVLINRELEGV